MVRPERPGSDEEPLLRPALGTLLFVVVVPGTVVVLIPYWLSGWRVSEPFLGVSAVRWLGVALGLAGLPLFFNFLLRFVHEGRGTPAPIAPPVHLVVGGAFRHLRNPGYVAVLSLLLAQALIFGSTPILWYAAVVGLAFHLFVVLYEEPTLRRQFGAEYEAYCRTVPRWFPRLR